MASLPSLRLPSDYDGCAQGIDFDTGRATAANLAAL
jgi:hypothetical protein